MLKKVERRFSTLKCKHLNSNILSANAWHFLISLPVSVLNWSFPLLDNTPPKFVGAPKFLNATVNEQIQILLAAEDKDGDTMTFNLAVKPDGAVIEKVNEKAVNLTWTPTSSENVRKKRQNRLSSK